MENLSALSFVLIMSFLSFSTDIFSMVIILSLLTGYMMINRHVKKYFEPNRQRQLTQDREHESSTD